MKFHPGQRVRMVRLNTRFGMNYEMREIFNLGGVHIVKDYDPVHKDGLRVEGERWLFPEEMFEPARGRIDLGKSIKTRAQGLVYSVKRDGDYLIGVIDVADRRMALSYDLDGLFYKNIEQPIDLVNA